MGKWRLRCWYWNRSCLSNTIRYLEQTGFDVESSVSFCAGLDLVFIRRQGTVFILALEIWMELSWSLTAILGLLWMVGKSWLERASQLNMDEKSAYEEYSYKMTNFKI